MMMSAVNLSMETSF